LQLRGWPGFAPGSLFIILRGNLTAVILGSENVGQVSYLPAQEKILRRKRKSCGARENLAAQEKILRYGQE
jgi:hypothetical protein